MKDCVYRVALNCLLVATCFTTSLIAHQSSAAGISISGTVAYINDPNNHLTNDLGMTSLSLGQTFTADYDFTSTSASFSGPFPIGDPSAALYVINDPGFSSSLYIAGSGAGAFADGSPDYLLLGDNIPTTSIFPYAGNDYYGATSLFFNGAGYDLYLNIFLLDSSQTKISSLSPAYVEDSVSGWEAHFVIYKASNGELEYLVSSYDYDAVEPPIDVQADAGSDQTINEGISAQLDGSNSTNAVNYQWSQIAGPALALSSNTAPNPTFSAPYLSSNSTLTFELVVDDGAGNVSDPDSVDITVVNFNNPPISDAGNDDTIKSGATGTLDGSNSYDPEGDAPLGYGWMQIAGTPVTLTPSDIEVSPSFVANAPPGDQLIFELEVDDGKEFSDPDDTVTITVVDNSAPVADAGPDQTVDEGALVALNGSNSSDPDGGDTLAYSWTESVALSDNTSATPSFTAPSVGPGGATLTFDLTVSDDDPVNSKSSSDQVIITVQNLNDPPDCSLAVASCSSSKIRNTSGCTLWPPNHKMVAVSIEGTSDPDNDTVAIQIDGVTQDEVVEGQGDGDTAPDAVISGDSVLVRAERAGGSNGRVYAVNFTADDGNGGTCSSSVNVTVPKSRKKSAIDDGQVFDSTQ